MKTPDLFAQYPSNTPVGSGNNKFLEITPGTYTYRMVIQPKFYGKHTWRFWYSNIVDSTWNMGAVSRSGLCGSRWQLLSASVGVSKCNDLFAAPLSDLTPVTYEGEPSRTVQPAEQFWSDPVTLDIPAGNYLVFSWCVSFEKGAILPCTPDSQVMCGIADGDHSADTDHTAFRLSTETVMPNLFGADLPVSTRMIFVGDSITQGIGSDPYQYNHWVAQISRNIGDQISVWDIGLGYARAQDLGRNNAWLGKAMHGDIVCIMLGVNDLLQGINEEEIFDSLWTAIQALRRNNPAVRIVLLTTPPFDYQGDTLYRWRNLIRRQKNVLRGVVDGLFETAPVWGKPSPEEHLSLYGGHPNARGSTAMAKAFCDWAARPEQDRIFRP